MTAMTDYNGTGSYISQSDKHYLIEVREIPCGKKDRVGYLIELADRTIEKKYYNAVEEYNSKLQEPVVSMARYVPLTRPRTYSPSR